MLIDTLEKCITHSRLNKIEIFGDFFGGWATINITKVEFLRVLEIKPPV